MSHAGCGTFTNLTAPPAGKAPPGIATNCAPLGGTFRSLFVGGAFVGQGLGEMTEVGKGGILKGSGKVLAGTYLVAVDTPLSLVGDVVTFPIAQARYEDRPWATWWGDPGRSRESMILPVAAESKEDGGVTERSGMH